MIFAKESTALDIKLGPFVDKGDGVAYEVGMAAAMDHATTGVRISVNGGAFGDRHEGTEPVYDAFGYYLVKLDTTDIGAAPRELKVIFGDPAVCLPQEENIKVINANVWDSLFGATATDYLQVDVLQLGGVTQSATDFKDLVDTGYNPATHKLAGVELVDVTTENTDMVAAPLDAAGVRTAVGMAAADLDDQIDTLATAEELGNIASGTAATNTVASSFTKAGAEPETGTYESTFELNGVFHIVEDDATSTEFFYEFSIGANGVPVSVSWQGYAQSKNDVYTINAYNWVTLGWDQIGSFTGKDDTKLKSELWDLITAHVGLAANAGLVRIQVTSADGTAFATDRILCSFATVYKSVGYSDGAIWIDTNGANAGSVDYIDGVADNPVNTWADALTLAASLGINKFQLIAGSSITLSANSDKFDIYGNGSAVALNGQSISAARFVQCSISGNDDGSNTSPARFFNCQIGTCTLGTFRMAQCSITDDITIAEASTYIMDACFSAVAGTATPNIDFGAAIGDTNLNMRHYSGGIEIENMGQTGTDKMSLEGFGQLIINANCTGGIIAIRGNFTVTDNASAAVTLSDNARIDQAQILDAVTDDATQIDASALNTLSGHDPGGTLPLGSAVTTIDGIVDDIKTTVVTNATGVDIAADIIALKTVADDVPNTAEFEARTLVTADYTIVSDLPSEPPTTAQIKTALEIDGGKLDHIWETTEDDTGVRRFTANALEEAPDTDTSLDAAGIQAAVGLASANLDTQLADLPTVAELEARSIVSADYTVVGDLPSEPLDAAGIQAAVGLASANLDTQIGAVPTVTEMNARTLLAADYFDPDNDEVDADIKKVNATTIKGTGVEGDLWGPA